MDIKETLIRVFEDFGVNPDHVAAEGVEFFPGTQSIKFDRLIFTEEGKRVRLSSDETEVTVRVRETLHLGDAWSKYFKGFSF